MKTPQRQDAHVPDSSRHTAKNCVRCGAILFGLLMSAACTETEVAAPTGGVNTKAAAAFIPESQTTPMACDLISEAEMTVILGSPVMAQRGDGHAFGQTSCGWSPETGHSPYAELKIEWGSGEAAMFATGILSGIEPGLTSPFEGLGDQARAVGPTVMIRRGEDLVTIILSVEDDPVPIVRKIYETVDARL